VAVQQAQLAADDLFRDYDTSSFFDEMFAAPGQARPHYAKTFQELAGMAPAQFQELRQLADSSFLLQGITFTVYSDGRGTERLFPFDLAPHILPHSEMGPDRARPGATRARAESVSAGCVRPAAHPERPHRAAVAGLFLPPFLPPDDRRGSAAGIYTHVAGIDLVRDSRTGHYLVLEDNVRTPSGISYVLENGQVMTRTLPVDVRVRPALDAEGREQLRETAAGPAQLPPADEPPQQQQQ